MDLETGFRNMTQTLTLPAGDTDFVEWELTSRFIAMTNMNCRLPSNGGIASIFAISGLGLF